MRTLLFLSFILICSLNLKTWAQVTPVQDFHSEASQKFSCQGYYRLGANFYYHQKPTAKESLTEFSYLNAQLIHSCTQDAGWSWGLEAEVSDQISDEGQLPILLRQLMLQSRSDGGLGVGLFWDPWIYFSNTLYGHHLNFKDARTIAARSQLLPESEFGAQWVSRGEQSEWGIRVSNGEPWPYPERGPNKDVLVWWRSQDTSPGDFRFMIYARDGRFDMVNKDSNQKSRFGFQFALVPVTGFRTGLSGMGHESGVDGLVQQNQTQEWLPDFGEGVDLTSSGGEKMKGQITEWWLAYRFLTTGAEVYMKASQAHLDATNSARQYVSGELGYAWQLAPSAKFTVFSSQTSYAPDFSSSVHNREFYGFSFELVGAY